jgi:aspartyl protease family protein
MKIITMLLPVAFLLAIPPQAGLAGVTEIKADDRGHYVTKAEIEGSDITVMVDTGASVVALSYEDADEIGLRPGSLTYDTPVMTANGQINAARVTLRRVEIDGVRVSDVEGMVMPAGAMGGSLLGMSFLSHLRSFRVEDGVLRLED